MREVPLDDDLRAKLGDDLSDEIALRDKNGQVVAYVVSPDHREMLYRLAANLIDDHKIEAARQEYRERGGKTTAEVLAGLAELDRKPIGKGA